MSFTTALYEGDSVIHTLRRFGDPALYTRAGVAKRASGPATALESAELATAELKGWTSLFEMVWNGLCAAGRWLDEKSRNAHYSQIESYLAQSTDHADLERRLRSLERGNRLNWVDCGIR